MEQFSLEKYLANPSRKVVTRGGQNVRIVCIDVKTKYNSVLALIDYGEYEYSVFCTKNGRHYYDGVESINDLFFASEKHEGWINIYRSEYEDYYQGKIIYSSKEDAIKRGEKTPYYITTTKIEWEE